MSFNLERYSKIRRAVKQNRERAKRDKENSPFFRVDRRNASAYMAGHPKFTKVVYGYLNKLKKEGKPFIYADICGEANAKGMGSDFDYSFSIKQGMFKTETSDSLYFKGDVFNKDDVLEFVNKVRTNGHLLNFVTFEPIVGLQGYDHSDNKEDRELHRQVAWQQLEDNLKLLLQVVAPGGYIYISKPFQLDATGLRDFMVGKKQNEYEASINMKQFARRNRLRIKIDSSIGGPIFLLNKPER